MVTGALLTLRTATAVSHFSPDQISPKSISVGVTSMSAAFGGLVAAVVGLFGVQAGAASDDERNWPAKNAKRKMSERLTLIVRLRTSRARKALSPDGKPDGVSIVQ